MNRLTRLLAPTAALLAVSTIGVAGPPDTQTFQLGAWRLEVRHDAFTRETRCKLANAYGHRPDLIAQPDALLVKLPGRLDRSATWFSVDDRPARPWRDVQARLIADGALAQTEALDDEAGGVLPLPYADIMSAGTISVRAEAGLRIRRYSLDRFWEMLAAARRLGCRLASSLSS